MEEKDALHRHSVWNRIIEQHVCDDVKIPRHKKFLRVMATQDLPESCRLPKFAQEHLNVLYHAFEAGEAEFLGWWCNTFPRATSRRNMRDLAHKYQFWQDQNPKFLEFALRLWYRPDYPDLFVYLDHSDMQNILADYCACGHVKYAKIALSVCPRVLAHGSDAKYVLESAHHGQKPRSIRWLNSLGIHLSPQSAEKWFLDGCGRYSTEYLTYMLGKFPHLGQEAVIHKAFLEACSHGSLKYQAGPVLSYLVVKYPYLEQDQELCRQGFLRACFQGQVSHAKFLAHRAWFRLPEHSTKTFQEILLAWFGWSSSCKNWIHSASLKAQLEKLAKRENIQCKYGTIPCSLLVFVRMAFTDPASR